MEGSGTVEKPSVALVPVDPTPERSGTAPPPPWTGRHFREPKEFARERNLLVLCTLYYLYGDKERMNVDWKVVADKILEQKIPVYGENFTAGVCLDIYNRILSAGIEIGIPSARAILRFPRKLKMKDLRMWMIAQLSTDIWRIGKLAEKRVKLCIKKCNDVIEAIHTDRPDGTANIHRQLSQAPTIDPEDDPEYKDLDSYENLDAQVAAVELWQLELLQNIVGTHDVLKLAQYCHEAAEYAVKRFLAIEAAAKAETICKPSDSMIAPDVSPQKPQDKTAELAKPANESPRKVAKPDNVPPTKPPIYIELSSDDECVKAISPTKPLSQSSVEILTAPPTTRQPESVAKQVDVTQQKTPTKPSTRSNSRDSTPAADSAKAASDFSNALALLNSPNANGRVEESSPAKSHASTITIGSSVDSPVRDPNGAVTRDAEVVKLVNEAVSAKPCLVEVTCSPTKQPSSDKSEAIVEPENKSDEAKEDYKKTESEIDEPVVLEASVGNVVTAALDEPAETSAKADEQPQAVKIKEQTKVTKGKPGPRKSIGAVAARKVFKRTSSRLTSPEPKEPAQNEEDKPQKRTRGRHASSSDVKPPVLRSRRVATPNATTPAAVAAVEKELIKTPSVDTKQDAVVTENNEEETFETPRTTPETPEMKNESDGNQDGKPKLKTYSAATYKPSSPLSHVDPKIFDEYDNDEDDPELAMIDNNINKTKGDKGGSVTKGFTKRGRTVSSEQVSENNEETSPVKRATRKGGPNDDVEESGEAAGQTDDENAKSKRLTRSSLKMHDAANDEGGEPSSRTESEKAVSESSFGGKEKKARLPKTMMRGRKLFDDKQRVSGEVETEESLEKKRVTRARAKTGTSFSEKRSKPSAESEVVSENEPTPTRATRSRASTSTSVAVNEPVPTPQPVLGDDEDAKFRKAALSLLEKVSGHDISIAAQKYFEDPEKVVKSTMTLQEIKQKIETGKLKSLLSIQKDLTFLGSNALFANPNSLQAKEAVLEYLKMLKDGLDVSNTEPKSQRNSFSQRMDTSDVESLESHDESRSESAPKSVVNSGGRRKRRRSASETSEDVFPSEKRRVTRPSVSSSFQQAASIRKPKHPISPDIVVEMSTSARNVRLRTNTKLDMDRQKAQEEDRRDKELQKQQRVQLQSTAAVPVTAQPTVNVVVPSNVLQVKSALENPTPFHVEQTRRFKIKQYCEGIASSLPDVQGTSSLGAATVNPLRPPAKHNRLHHLITDGTVSSAPPNYSTTPVSPISVVEPPVPSSPGPSQRSSVATSVNDEFEDSILDLILTDEKTGDVASLPQTGFNRISGIPEGSSSCPVDSNSDGVREGPVKLTKDRIKKDNHNKIERKRRFHINDMITEQSRLLPRANERHHEKIGEVKQNKGSILKASVDYTKVLKHDNESLYQKLQKSEQEKKELLLRLQRMEQLCKQSGVQIPENIVTWKTGSTPEDITNLLSTEVRIKQEPLPYAVDEFDRSVCDMMDEDRSIVTGSDPMFGQVETDEGFHNPEGMDFND